MADTRLQKTSCIYPVCHTSTLQMVPGQQVLLKPFRRIACKTGSGIKAAKVISGAQFKKHHQSQLIFKDLWSGCHWSFHLHLPLGWLCVLKTDEEWSNEGYPSPPAQCSPHNTNVDMKVLEGTITHPQSQNPQQENPDSNSNFLRWGQLTSERELEKIQGDSWENLYEEGPHRLFSFKKRWNQFILGVYKIMSGLEGLERKRLFSVPSNVKMRGHGIKPVKATFEQAKGDCSSSHRKHRKQLPQRHSEHKEFTWFHRDAEPWLGREIKCRDSEFTHLHQWLKICSLLVHFSQHVPHQLMPHSFCCSQLRGTSVSWQPRMPEPVLTKDRDQMKISLLTFVSYSHLNACNTRRGDTLI